MNDTIKKIKVQIDYHQAELSRLQSALDVYAEYEARPAAKELPMFTVKKIGATPDKPEKAKKKDREVIPGKRGIPVRKQVLATLEYTGKPMSRADILASINLAGRSHHSLDSCLSTLRKDGKLYRNESGEYSFLKPVVETAADDKAA